MPHSPRRHGKALLGAAAAALLCSPAALAAAPEVYHVAPDPGNPRTGTEVTLHSYAVDPDDTAVQYAWDFAGGTAFGPLSAANTAKHTFTTDGIHWLTLRAQDAGGEITDTRVMVATHPGNWNPIGEFDSSGYHANLLTERENGPTGQYLAVHMYDPDSPESGWGTAWDLDNDGDFNDGAGDGEPLVIEGETYHHQRIAHFTSDGEHPVKVRFTDGQGGQTVVPGTVRTHTANEGPYSFATPTEREFDLATVSGGKATLQTNWSDDYSYSATSYAWKIGDAVQAGATGKAFTLPSNLGVGTHEVFVTATDDGRLPTDVESPTGPALSSTLKITVKVVAKHPASLYASGIEHGPDATFRTLENIMLYASPASDQHASAYAWDLDNDGQFDDSTGYGTLFAAATKGTYRVAVRMTVTGSDPVVISRDLVVDTGQDYAPSTGTGGQNGGGGNTGGGNTGGGTVNPPAPTPEQLKAAMVTFLGAETIEFLQLVGGLNKKGIDAAKAILSLGTLGPDQLPNGGTGRFDVYDKAPKLARAAAAKKPKLLGTTKVTLAKGEKKAVKVKLNKKGKALLKKKGKVKLTVQATLTDALTGASVKQVKSYTFKVKRKKRR